MVDLLFVFYPGVPSANHSKDSADVVPIGKESSA